MITEMAQPSGRQFRVALIGSRGVGKTSWLRRNLTGEFRENYIPTSWKDKEIRDLKFSTRDGDSIVLTFETKLACNDPDQNDNYTDEGKYDAAILMYDLCQVANPGKFYREAANYSQIMKRWFAKAIPTLYLRNKFDVDTSNDEWVRKMALPEVRTNSAYFPVSVKTCYCLDEPMTWLLRRLTGRSDLELDNSSCLTPISNGEAVTPSTQIKKEEKHSKSQQQPLIAST